MKTTKQIIDEWYIFYKRQLEYWNNKLNDCELSEIDVIYRIIRKYEAQVDCLKIVLEDIEKP